MKRVAIVLSLVALTLITACGRGPGAPVEVASATPQGNEVPVGTVVAVEFTDAVQEASLEGNVTLSSSAGQVSGVLHYDADNRIATFTPDSELAYATEYSASVAEGVNSASGGALVAPYSWTFVTMTDPADIDPHGGNDGTGGDGTGGDGTGGDGTGGDGTGGDGSGGDGTGGDGTGGDGTGGDGSGGDGTGGDGTGGDGTGDDGTGGDGTDPVDDDPEDPLAAKSPADGAVDVSVCAVVSFVFFADIDPATVNDSTFKMSRNTTGEVIAGEFNYDSETRTVTFVPDEPLVPDQQYRVLLKDQVTYADGSRLEEEVNWGFRTSTQSAETCER